MDKRFTPLSPPEQLMTRKQAIEDVLAHPEWTLQQQRCCTSNAACA